MWGWIFVGSAVALIEMTSMVTLLRGLGLVFGGIVAVFLFVFLMAPVWVGMALAHHQQIPLFTMLGIHV